MYSVQASGAPSDAAFLTSFHPDQPRPVAELREYSPPSAAAGNNFKRVSAAPKASTYQIHFNASAANSARFSVAAGAIPPNHAKPK